MRYKTLNQAIVGIFTVLAIVAFILLYITNSSTRVVMEQTPTAGIDEWSIENSVLNGAKLEENKNIYKLDDKSEITSIYITVFPTEAENGIIDFSAFDLHESLDQTYNPILDANVIIGDKNGSLAPTLNTDRINATIRVRGNSARGAKFKSYKIEFTSKDDTFKGQKILNLNKHPYDISKISNKFCFDIMSELENMASLRTNFTKVYIRDASLPEKDRKYTYYGLYTNVEQPNKTFLTSHGLDANGTLYKAVNFEFKERSALKNIDAPDYNKTDFEKILDIREAKDHSKLINMLKDINDYSKNFNDNFNKYFNEDNYLTWMATNILLGNEDTIAHNFILYNPSNSLTWYMLPWDYDGTFAFGEFARASEVPIELKGIQRLTGVTLHKRYFLIPGNVQKLTNKMNYLLGNNMTKEQVNGLLSKYKPVLNSTMTIAPDVGLLRMAPNELSSYLDKFHGEIEGNYRDYMASLKFPTPIFTATPEKTKDGEYKFSWDSSFDFEGDLITYSIKLATDINMKNIVFTADNLTETSYIYRGSLNGRYYMQVSIKDSKGNIQYSLDYTRNPNTGIINYGIRAVILE